MTREGGSGEDEYEVPGNVRVKFDSRYAQFSSFKVNEKGVIVTVYQTLDQPHSGETMTHVVERGTFCIEEDVSQAPVEDFMRRLREGIKDVLEGKQD